jgi:hypothetical protein
VQEFSGKKFKTIDTSNDTLLVSKIREEAKAFSKDHSLHWYPLATINTENDDGITYLWIVIIVDFLQSHNELSCIL